MNNDDTTVTLKTESFEEAVEREAHNMFVSIKLQHDQERLRKATIPRLQQLLKEADLPTQPTEEETIENIKTQLIDSYRANRIQRLAENAAQAEFRKLYPEMFSDDKGAQ